MLTKDEVQHIAGLARIELSNEEVAKYQEELGAILDYFALLQEADVTGKKPMTHSVVLENVSRKDIAKAKREGSAKQLIDMAPVSQNGYLKVKSIL
jgi:aspartyl-tRNA(Asn)/glutamyl-tRNA(Gln) amidotransferase subunit C